MKILLKSVIHDKKHVDVLIQDDKIAKICNDLHDDCVDDVIECSDKAIIPSFCNTHTHASMMFLRGIGEDKDLFEWLQEEIWPREAKIRPEDVYNLSRFAMLEMIKTGTTMFNDMYFHSEYTVLAAQEMGLRGVISYVGMDFFDDSKTAQQEREAEDFMSMKVESANIIKSLSCHSVYTTSERLFKVFKQCADRYGTYLHIHANETKKEVSDCIQKTGLRPIEFMCQLGVLGEKTILAHCVHLNDNEIKLLRANNTAVSHCPASNLKLNSGQMPFQAYIDEGIVVTLGTDGVASNNALSMMSEMRLAALSGKNIANSPKVARVQDIFSAGTKKGFEFFGIDAGEIKEGKKADFILVDVNNHFLIPNNNIFSNIIYSADSSCIKDVFCNGKQIMKDGYVENEEKIVNDFRQTCRYLLNG